MEVIDKMKNLFYIIYILLITGCYDSLLITKIINKTGRVIEIEQYSAPKYFHTSIDINQSKVLDAHVDLIVCSKNIKYYYNLYNAIGSNTQKLVKRNLIRIIIDKNMLLYVIPNKYHRTINFEQLKQIQPNSFPLFPFLKSKNIR